MKIGLRGVMILVTLLTLAGQFQFAAAQESCTWTGVWDTSYNKMTLQQTGNQVEGIYEYNNGKVQGTVTGDTLDGKWIEPSRSGGIRFKMAPDCKSWSGGWSYDNGVPGDDGWSGTRVGAAPASANGGNVPTGAFGCDWGIGKMPGCVALRYYWANDLTSIDIDLFNLAAETVTSPTPQGQQAAIAQLNTGQLDVLLQDDTTVYCAQLILNTTPTEVCDASNPTRGASSNVINAVSDDPENKLWNCETNRQPLGQGTYDFSSCLTFNYQVPPEGITSAILHYGVKVQDGSTDGTILALGRGPVDPLAEPNTSVSGMTLQAAKRTVIAGDLVTIPVWLIKAGNVSNLNFDMTYDSAVVKPEGEPTKGNLLDSALFSANTKQNGVIHAGFAQTSGLSGTGTVMNVTFRAVGKPGDRTPLDLAVTTINDPGGGTLTIARIPGEIVLANSDGTIPTTPPSVGGGGGGTTTANPPPIPPGDCDGDIRLTELDALCALEMSVQLRAVQLIVDVDNSGDVTSRDAVIILQRAVGGQ